MNRPVFCPFHHICNRRPDRAEPKLQSLRQPLSFGGQNQGLSAAIQQADTKMFFKAPQLLADCSVTDVKSPPGLNDISCLSKSCKCPERGQGRHPQPVHM